MKNTYRAEWQEIAALAAEIGPDLAVPGVRRLLQALSETRARNFVRNLQSASGGKVQEAQAAIRSLAATPKGRKVLSHVVREVLIGTEQISLAAMAVLVGEYNADENSAEFVAHASRAIDGLSDDDAFFYLCLLSRPASCDVCPSKWRLSYRFDPITLQDTSWQAVRTLVGLDEEDALQAIQGLLSCRLLLSDPTPSRMSDRKHVAPRFFAFPKHVFRYYGVLFRAVEIVDGGMVDALSLVRPEQVLSLWKKKAQDGPAGRKGG